MKRYIEILLVSISLLFVSCDFDLRDPDDPSDFVDRDVMQLQAATMGDDLEGLNFIIMGDGYTTDHMTRGGLYEVMMNATYDALFDIEPMMSYRDYFNVYFVAVVSKDSGVAEGNDTALKSTFGEGTLIGNEDGTEDSTDAAYSYAGVVSGVDLSKAVIVVVVNSSQYAGTTYFFSSGRSIAYCPVVYNSLDLFEQIVHHEAVGHGFGRLLDEYIYYDTTITDEYVAEIERNKRVYSAGANISTTQTPTPWDHFLLDDEYNDVVSTYEGGYFYSKGVWRSEFVSCMCDNRAYFSAPSREAMVMRIMEQSGLTYDYNEFAATDVANSTATPPDPISASSYASGSSRVEEDEEASHIKLHPPIFLD